MHRKTVVMTLFAAAALLISVGTPYSKAQEKRVAPALPSGWSAPVNISNEPGNSEAPTIVVDNNGRVYATWTEWYGGVGATRGMMFNSTDAEGQWGTTTGSALFYPVIDDVGFPVVACHPTNGHAYVLYHDGDLANANMEILYREYVNNLEVDAAWMSLTPNSSSYVTAAVNPVDNALYAVWMDDVSGTDLFELGLKYRNPTTGVWSFGDVIPTGITSGKYWPHLNFDAKGTAHLLFITRPPAIVYYMKNATPQNPSTWTAPVNLSNDTARDWVAPRLAADKDGDVYVVWYANTGGWESSTEEVFFRKTVSGVWQAPINLSNTAGRSEGGFIAVNPDTKDVYVAYHEFFGGVNWEVMLKTYDAAKGTWSESVNMTQSTGHDGEPCIRVDKTGGLHLAYHYLQDDGNMEIYYTMKPGGPQPPTSIALDWRTDSTGTKKINRITWTNNPSNSSLALTGNKIWRKLASAADSAFTVLATAAATAVQYEDTGLDVQTKYAYRVTVVPESGTESQPSATVAETAGRIDLPPVNLAVTSGVNKVLFYREKANTIRFDANSGNVTSDVSGYDIYRKLSTESDSQLTFVKSLGASVMSYIDTKLSLTKNYSYAVKTKFSDGKSSAFSTVVGDK
jgi:hypothetical protein